MLLCVWVRVLLCIQYSVKYTIMHVFVYVVMYVLLYVGTCGALNTDMRVGFSAFMYVVMCAVV